MIKTNNIIANISLNKTSCPQTVIISKIQILFIKRLHKLKII